MLVIEQLTTSWELCIALSYSNNMVEGGYRRAHRSTRQNEMYHQPKNVYLCQCLTKHRIARIVVKMSIPPGDLSSEYLPADAHHAQKQ